MRFHLNRMIDTTAATLKEHPKAQLARSVEFTDGNQKLSISFYTGDHTGGAIVCGSWSNNSDWSGMNNLRNYGHGPGQEVTWAHQHDSGVLLAARWFMAKHAEANESYEKQKYEERQQDRKDRREREAARAADRKRRGIVLKGGTGQATGPLFKLPKAA
jgi:hypothetical protein